MADDDKQIFNITGPGGAKFKVTTPKGVTEDEVRRRLVAQKLPPSDPSFAQDFLAGFTAPVRGGAQFLEKMHDPLGNKEAMAGEGVKKEPKVPQAPPEEGSVGYTLGSMVGPAGVGGAAARLAPRVIGPVARATIAGGASAALQPVEGTDEFFKTKAEQVGEGMTLGFGLGWAGKAASGGIHALGDFLVRKYPENITTQAVNAVIKRIQQDSKYGAPTAQQALDLVEAANASGKPMALTDVGGRNLRSLGGHITRTPGESRGMAESFFIPRDEAAAKRLAADIDKYVSSGQSMREASEALLTSRSAAARPLYADTDKLQGIWSPRLQEFLDNPDVARGMARGYHIERLNSLAEGRPFDPTMMGVDLDQEGNIHLLRSPNMRVLDMGKQGLDAMIGEHRNELTGKLDSMGVALDRVRKAYVAELDGLDKSGTYKRAREAWGGYSASLDAIRAGRQAFSQSPEENAAMLGKMTAGDKEFSRIGLANLLRERLGKAGFNSDESRALIRNPWMRDQMRPFFKSDEEFNKFVDAVSAENVMAKTKNELLRGSQTAERLAEDQDEGASKMAGGARIAKSLFEGRFFSAVSEMWRLHRDVSRKPDPALNEAIAKILFSPDISQTEIGQRLLKVPEGQTGNYLAGAAQVMGNVATPAAAAAAGQTVP